MDWQGRLDVVELVLWVVVERLVMKLTAVLVLLK